MELPQLQLLKSPLTFNFYFYDIITVFNYGTKMNVDIKNGAVITHTLKSFS